MTANLPPNPEEEKIPPPKEPQKEPIKPKNAEDVFDYLKSNVRETIAYILLVLGILLIYFQPLIGGLLVGIVGGVYFSDEISSFLKNWREHIESEGIPRSLVIAGITFAFFLSAPAIFIGIALALLIKQFFNPMKHE